MLDPNLSKAEISDDFIIEEYKNPKKYTRANLYSIMAVRANHNKQIKVFLFEMIKDKKKRDEFFVGAIIHSWLPVLHILEHGKNDIKIQMKAVMSENWSDEEKRLFLNYIKKDQEYYSLLNDI